MGVVTVANGGVLHGIAEQRYGIALGWDNNANGYAVLNILKRGYVQRGQRQRAIDLGANGAGNTGILNLTAAAQPGVFNRPCLSDGAA